MPVHRLGTVATLFRFQTFGLTIACDRRLPGLVPAGAGSDCSLTIHSTGLPAGWAEAATLEMYVSTLRRATGRPALTWRRSPGEGFDVLDFGDGCRYALDRGAEQLWLRWRDGQPSATDLDRLFGPLLAMVLRRRGRLCLHASGLAVDGSALLLAAHEGAGKSTLAALLGQHGLSIQTDDVAAISVSDEGSWCHAGPPWLRLRAAGMAVLEVAASGADDDESFATVDAGSALHFAAEAARLASIVILAPASGGPTTPVMSRLSGRAAVRALYAHSWATHLPEAPERRGDLDRVTQLAGSLPVLQVVYRPGAATLPAVAAALLERLDHLTDARSSSPPVAALSGP